MKNLQFHNPRFITYVDDRFTIDILGGVDVEGVERMICTLRISYGDYPPLRSTLDLYSDPQTDHLIRTLCDKWGLAFTECSRSVHGMVMQLEEYRLNRLRYPRRHSLSENELSEEDRQEAVACLSDPCLIENLQQDLERIGIPVAAENALILFLAMASHTYSRPFSVICTTGGTHQHRILQKLSQCLPEHRRSLHTHISENALYYFESHQVDGKVLLVEDLEWTSKMLKPLSALQSTGYLAKTQATKNKDGLLYATTFEVQGRLCMIACTREPLKADHGNLPFLTLSLAQNSTQDTGLLHYEKQYRAGLIDPGEVLGAQKRLRDMLQSLSNVSIKNPYAPLIELPPEVENPHRAMLLLLDFIEVITFFFQHQREPITDPESGEIYIETHPDDIALAFRLLKNNLLSHTDEVSSSAKALYDGLHSHPKIKEQKSFTAADIRKEKRIHPRTLNRYLKELVFFHYLAITGGNKFREGYRYKLSDLTDTVHRQGNTEAGLQTVLKQIRAEYIRRKGTPIKEKKPPENQHPKREKDTLAPKETGGRRRIEEAADHTLKILREREEEEPGQTFTSHSVATLTGRSSVTEGRYLKELAGQGLLKRTWSNRQYFYTLLTTASGTAGQKPVSRPTSRTGSGKKSRTTAQAQQIHIRPR